MKASTGTTTASGLSHPPSGSSLPTANAVRSSRIAPHSHIRGLGLDVNGLAVADSAGFVGQDMAREVRVILCYWSWAFIDILLRLAGLLLASSNRAVSLDALCC